MVPKSTVFYSLRHFPLPLLLFFFFRPFLPIILSVLRCAHKDNLVYTIFSSSLLILEVAWHPPNATLKCDVGQTTYLALKFSPTSTGLTKASNGVVGNSPQLSWCQIPRQRLRYPELGWYFFLASRIYWSIPAPSTFLLLGFLHLSYQLILSLPWYQHVTYTTKVVGKLQSPMSHVLQHCLLSNEYGPTKIA